MSESTDPQPLPAGAVRDGVLRLSELKPGVTYMLGAYADPRNDPGVGLPKGRLSAPESRGGAGDEVPAVRAPDGQGEDVLRGPDAADVLQHRLRELEHLILDYGRIREQRGAHIGIPDARVAHVYRKIRDALRELGLNDGDNEDTVTGRAP